MDGDSRSKIEIGNSDTNSIDCDAIQNGVVEAIGDQDAVAREESFDARSGERHVPELDEGET